MRKKLVMSLMLASVITITGVPVFADTVSTMDTTIETEVIENETIGKSPRTSTLEVMITNAKLREKPGKGTKIIRTLKKGECLNGGREFVKKDGYTWTWVQCQKDSTTGWVAMEHLKEIG